MKKGTKHKETFGIKKSVLALLVLFVLTVPYSSSAQITVPQGGTGTTTFPANWFVVGNSSLRLTATGTPYFSAFSADRGTLGTLTLSSMSLGDFLITNGCAKIGNTSTTTLCGNGVNSYFIGNLGIGSTTPWAKLSVTSTSTIDTDAAFVVEDSASPDTTPFIILNTGNVGIGTANPNVKLDVRNVISVGTAGSSNGALESPASLLFNIDSNNDQDNALFRVDTNVTGLGGGTPLFSIDELGRVGIGDELDSDAALDINPTATYTGPLFIIASSSNERLRVTTDGNVGIGTTAPDGKLEIFITDGAGVNIDQALNLERSGANSVGDTTRISFFGVGTDLYGSIDSVVSAAATGDMVFGTRNSGTHAERMRITGAGNVGIGDSTPDYLLDVAGTAGFDSNVTLTGSAANIILGSNYLSGDGGDEGVFVDSTGNVGIGTTTPSAFLTIADSSAGDPMFRIVSGTAGDTDAFNGGYATEIRHSSGGAVFDNVLLYLDENAAGRDVLNIESLAGRVATFGSDGNVGINDTSPDFKLDVDGTVGFPGISAGAAGDTDACLNATTNELTDAAASTCIVSSIRFKENIETLRNNLDKLLQLRPVSYNYKPELDSSKVKRKPRIGLIAEEVERIDPRLVEYEEDGVTPRTIRYEEGIVTLLVGAIQDIWERMMGYESRLDRLERENTELKARIKALERK